VKLVKSEVCTGAKKKRGKERATKEKGILFLCTKGQVPLEECEIKGGRGKIGRGMEKRKKKKMTKNG